MNDQITEQQLEEAWQNFVNLPWEATLSARQGSFELFSLQQRAAIKTELLETLPEVGQLTFEQINTMLVVTGFGAIREGAKAYASLAYPTGAPLTATAVSFEDLSRAADATARPDSPEYAALRQEMTDRPLLNALVSTSGQALLNNLITRIEPLKKYEEPLQRTIFSNLVHGIRLEFLYSRLIEQDANQRRLMARLIHQIDHATDEFDVEAVEFLKERFSFDGAGTPWPRDLVCVCGASLQDSLRCCDAPVDPKTFADDLDSEFLLKTSCCGATLTGFRCTECGCFHSWAKGIVDSHSR